MDPVLSIAALAACFLLSHFALSHPPVRAPLIARLGAGPFAGAYSVVSAAFYLPLVWIWWTHRHAGAALWVLRTPLAVHLAELVVASGVALLVAGVLQPPPSSMSAASRPIGAVHGVHHVTRHPVLMGSALLGLGHLVPNGWLGDVLFWGSHAALGLLGALHQDARMRTQRPGYSAFAAATSVLPNPLGLARVGGRTAAILAAGLAVAFGIRYAHRWF